MIIAICRSPIFDSADSRGIRGLLLPPHLIMLMPVLKFSSLANPCFAFHIFQRKFLVPGGVLTRSNSMLHGVVNTDPVPLS